MSTTTVSTSTRSKRRNVACANPGEKSWKGAKGSFVFAFSHGGFDTHTYVFAYGHIEDALESAAEWLYEHAPGYFVDDYVTEEYNRLIAEGLSVEEAQDGATMDLTYTESGYLESWCWGIALDCPTPAQLASFVHGRY